MRRVKGIARAVLTIAGAISLSSPLLATSANGVAQKSPVRQRDRPGIVKEGRILSGSVTEESFFRRKTGESTDVRR
jgi:hypothetical protein